MKSITFSKETVNLAIVEKPYPTPSNGEVVIRLMAAALNHRELNIIRAFQKRVKENPSLVIKDFTFGSDGVGVIEALGEDVTDYQVGDQVIFSSVLNGGLFGTTYDGTFSEYIKVPFSIIEKKPFHLTMEEAAAIPLAFGTAWRIIVNRAEVKSGDTVLIHGIGGGVALYCLQIANALGAKVIVTSSSTEKLTNAIAAGAHLGIDYTNEDIIEKVKQFTNQNGVDVVVDGVGTNTMSISMKAVKTRGKIIAYGLVTGDELQISASELFMREISLMGADVIYTQDEFKNMIDFIDKHKIKPFISHTFPFEQINDAMDQLRNGNQFGKIVLTIFNEKNNRLQGDM